MAPHVVERHFLDAIEWADWVWAVQGDLPSGMNTKRDKLKGKRVGLLLGGGQYRDNRARYQGLWGAHNPLSVCYEADLVGGFENEHLVIPPLSLDWVPLVERNWTGFRIGHFPSRPTDKGSEWIVPLCREYPGFHTSVVDPSKSKGVNRLLWKAQLERMAQCDVVVDQIKPTINGRPFGEWVSIATETAFLGRIPIANSLNPEPYRKTYGTSPGVHICNDEQALRAELDRLSGLSRWALEQEQDACLDWAVTYHSLVPTGVLLKKLCEA